MGFYDLSLLPCKLTLGFGFWYKHAFMQESEAAIKECVSVVVIQMCCEDSGFSWSLALCELTIFP